MTNEELQLLPLGTSAFSMLRSWKELYVDKTSQIYELASKPEKFLLIRPRRFGKSLLVSTFKSLFKYGLRDFKGLAIEKLWKEEKSYHVVHLDFSLVKYFFSIKAFNKDLAGFLLSHFMEFGFHTDKTEPSLIFNDFADWFKRQPRNSFVILIDEYDAPLTACLEKPKEFEAVRSKLSEFYSVINSNDAAIRFLFITGITKFHDARILSGLKNLKDISLLPEFGTLLGFTQEEVELYFKDYLTDSAKKLGMEESELVKELTAHYGGYCFENTATTRVLAPWSVVNHPGLKARGL